MANPTRTLATLRALTERPLGGIIPAPSRPRREVHTFDGCTYHLRLSWLRRTFEASYWTPRMPRSVIKARAATDARTRAVVDRELAAIERLGPKCRQWDNCICRHGCDIP
jgi:hypothetical protein